MKSILKWPGGKEKELPVIRAYTPQYGGRFAEPFVGGGAVFFDTDAAACCINDKSAELINLYSCIRNEDRDLYHYLSLEAHEFASISDFVDTRYDVILELYHSGLSVPDFIRQNNDFFSHIAAEHNSIFIEELQKNLSGKIVRSNRLELRSGKIPDSDRICNIEAALKSAYYMYIRYMLNHSSALTPGRQAAVFFFIREYCYSSMFRYNENGAFNVPYGGISYNRKDFQKKVDYLFSEQIRDKLCKTVIRCEDFEDFIDGLDLTADDFVFLDPPYDSGFSTYAQNAFGHAEQIRLCECLQRTHAKFLLIIKNTDFIYDLYRNDFNITSFDKKYLVSFMSRNDRSAEHLAITNY